MNRAIPAFFGVIGLCVPLLGQQADPKVEGFAAGQSLALSQSNLGKVDGLAMLRSLSMPALRDGQYFPGASASDGIGGAPLNSFPYAYTGATERQKYNASLRYRTDTVPRIGDLRLNDGSAGGEVGVLYGRSSGKYGGDLFQSYIIGTAGNEHFQVTAGASYEEWTGRSPRRR